MSIHGCQIHVEDTGGSRPPIVFLHGLLFDGRMFDEQVAALRDRYRCITMDFRGQGRSAPAARGYQVEQQTADALALVRRLRLPAAHLVGLSMGGYVAMRIAARCPQHVLSLALLNTGAGPHPRVKYPEHLGLAAAARVLGPGHSRVADEVDRAMYGPLFVADPSTEALRQTWRERWGQLDVPSVLRTLTGLMVRPDFRAELVDITAPTLALTGSLDSQHPPADARQIADGVADGAIIELPGVGHSASIEAPRDVTAAIERLVAGARSAGTSSGRETGGFTT